MEWDTNFWNVGLYNANKLYEAEPNELDYHNELDSTPYIIQALANDSDIDYINFLVDNNFRFVESKVNLVKEVQEESEIVEVNAFQDAKVEDFHVWKDKFYSLYGGVSRFSSIGSKQKINEFYYTWVTNSIKGELDDNCVGYYGEDSLEGFITYKISNKKLVIGLIGVFPEFQGKKISQRLLCFINNLSINNNCNKIYVSTQGRNTKAINAYIKSGFLINNIMQWYYCKGGF
nr:GNAT family N-acetyltransferase [Natronobacillus azotifigens]